MPKFGLLPPLASSIANTSCFYITIKDNNKDNNREDYVGLET